MTTAYGPQQTGWGTTRSSIHHEVEKLHRRLVPCGGGTPPRGSTAVPCRAVAVPWDSIHAHAAWEKGHTIRMLATPSVPMSGVGPRPPADMGHLGMARAWCTARGSDDAMEKA